MTHGSLFSGIGGFDLAAQWMGWENIFHCEYDPFCQKVLAHHFPQSKLYEAVRKMDATQYRGRIDVLSGGFPCQPFSTAGKRKGTEDERHLWPSMCRIIREIQPGYVVGENVRGLLNWNDGLVFEEVCSDLENAGYEVTPYILPACGVGAPHRRDRVWFVAHRNTDLDIGNTQREIQKGKETDPRRSRSSMEGIVAHSDDFGKSRTPRRDESESRGEGVQERDEVQHLDESDSVRGFSPDTDGERLQCKSQNRELEGGRFSVNDARSHESKWEEFPTVPPICGGDDGLPRKLDAITFPKWRKESIKAYGNAIVPQVALQIFKAIELTEAQRANY